MSIARGDGWLNLREEGLRNALSVLGLQTDTLVKRRDVWKQSLCVEAKARKTVKLKESVGGGWRLVTWRLFTCLAFVVEEMMVFLGWVVTCLPSSPGSHSLTFLLSYWAFTFLYAVSPQLLVMIVLWLPYPFSLPWAISWTCPVCLIHCSFPSQGPENWGSSELREQRQFDTAFLLPKGLKAGWDTCWGLITGSNN